MKLYKTERGAKIAAGRVGGRVVRRDRFGRFNKRGRQWSVIKFPRRRKKPPVPPPPPKGTEYFVKIISTRKAKRGGGHFTLIDMTIRSKNPMTPEAAQAHIRNLANGIKLPKGVRVDAIEWTHKEGPQAKFIQGGKGDIAAMGGIILQPEEFTIERKE